MSVRIAHSVLSCGVWTQIYILLQLHFSFYLSIILSRSFIRARPIDQKILYSLLIVKTFQGATLHDRCGMHLSFAHTHFRFAVISDIFFLEFFFFESPRWAKTIFFPHILTWLLRRRRLLVKLQAKWNHKM